MVLDSACVMSVRLSSVEDVSLVFRLMTSMMEEMVVMPGIYVFSTFCRSTVCHDLKKEAGAVCSE